MKRGGPLKRYTPLKQRHTTEIFDSTRKRKWNKLKKRKAPTASSLKKKLWKLFSEYIRRKGADDDGTASCVSCGTTAHWKNLQAGHYVSRSAGLSLYFDEINVSPQCVSCNIFKGGNLPLYALYLRRTYGDGILEALDAKRREFRKISTSEYLEMIERYKSKLEALGKKEAA